MDEVDGRPAPRLHKACVGVGIHLGRRLTNSVSRMVNLTTLAPVVQAAILDETLRDTASLFDLAVDMPQGWAEQRKRVA